MPDGIKCRWEKRDGEVLSELGVLCTTRGHGGLTTEATFVQGPEESIGVSCAVIRARALQREPVQRPGGGRYLEDPRASHKNDKRKRQRQR